MKDIQQIVEAVWNGPHPPKFGLHGHQCRLDHPFGPSVVFDVTRADLALPVEQFSARILMTACARLRAQLTH